MKDIRLVCMCCMILAANGELCECENQQDEHPAGLLGKLTNGEHVVVGDEYGFSRSGCEGCGTTYHGDRFEVFVFKY